MQDAIERKVTGWLFVAAAVLFWGGWMLLHEKIDQYFVAEDFPAVKEHLAYWISVYRMHIFGVVVTVLALMAFAVTTSSSPARILIWPGTAVAVGGMFVWAVAAAFYYHFGAWGGLVYGERSLADRQGLVDGLLLHTEYVACLVRFGHVFSGLGLVVMGAGILAWRLLPKWLAIWAIAMGVVGMAVTMGLPEYPVFYLPVFHAYPLWMACMGLSILRSGLTVTVIEPLRAAQAA
jgi:hypothetical protein